MTSKHLVNYILDRGAAGTVTMDDFVRSFDGSNRITYSVDNGTKAFGENVTQPIEIAVVFEQTCDIVARLISAGADPSTITQQTWATAMYNTDLPNNGKTVLDTIRDNIKRCKSFLEKEDETPQFKERVLFGPEVLDAYEPGSYQRFCAEHQLRVQNKARKQHNETKVSAEVIQKNFLALQKKKAAVEKLLESLRETEKTLVDAGAKTYHELFPEKLELLLKEQEAARLAALQPPAPQWGMSSQWGMSPQWGLNVPSKPTEETDHIFSVNNSFHAPYLGEGDIQGAYLRLFKAIWRGAPEDASLVKELALGPTGEGKSKLPALRISVADHQGYTTLWLALYRRNWDMARLIVSIVNEQYEPPNKRSKEERYVLERSSQTTNDEITMDTITTEFTIENIGAKRDLVKCSSSPFVGLLNPLYRGCWLIRSE